MPLLPQSFFSVPQLAVVVFSMLPLLSVPLLKKLAKDNKKYYFILKTNKQTKQNDTTAKSILSFHLAFIYYPGEVKGCVNKINVRSLSLMIKSAHSHVPTSAHYIWAQLFEC